MLKNLFVGVIVFFVYLGVAILSMLPYVILAAIILWLVKVIL